MSHVVLKFALGPVDGHRPRRLGRRQGGGDRHLGDRRAGQRGQPLVVRRGHVVVQLGDRFEALSQDERHRLAPVGDAAAAHGDDDVGLHLPRLPGGVEAQPVGGELPAVAADRRYHTTQPLLDPVHPRGALFQGTAGQQQRPAAAQLFEHRSQALVGTGAPDHVVRYRAAVAPLPLKIVRRWHGWPSSRVGGWLHARWSESNQGGGPSPCPAWIPDQVRDDEEAGVRIKSGMTGRRSRAPYPLRTD